MKRMRRKLLTLILTAGIILSLLPLNTVLAEENQTPEAEQTQPVSETAAEEDETEFKSGSGDIELPEVTITPVPTETPEPTGTPEPTETPEPTGTPEPTETPEPEKIPIRDVVLRYDALSYTGKARSQSTTLKVTAMIEGEEVRLTEKKDYTVSYENNINAGEATLIVDGIGDYSGHFVKHYTITPATVKKLDLQYTSMVYTGEERKQMPALVAAFICSKWVPLEYGRDYTITWSGDIAGPGKVKLTVEGCGNYTGTLSKSYNVVPETTSIRSITALTRRAAVQWNKIPSNTYGVWLQYSTSSDFSTNVKSIRFIGDETTETTVTGLTAGKTYYYRMRTYSVVRKTCYYSGWSPVQKCKLYMNTLQAQGNTNGKRSLTLDNSSLYHTAVSFALWSDRNGQDDLAWISASKDSTGRWNASFDVADFRNTGVFHLHAYSGEKFIAGLSFTIDAAEVETQYSKLAENLTTAKNNDQLILVGASGTNCTVTMLNKNADGTWYQLLSTSGNVGSNGIGEVTEWNRKTPVGVYAVTEAFGIYPNPGTVLPYTQVDGTYYWVDDVNSPYYNRFVTTRTTPYNWNSAEHIIDYTGFYQYCLAMDFNKNCVSGAGSAIFLHVGNGQPTQGCVSVPLAQMEKITKYVRPGCKIIIDTPENLKNY